MSEVPDFSPGLDIRGAVDGGDDELAAAHLLGGEAGTDAGRVIDREDRVDLGKAGEKTCVTAKPPSREPLAS